MATHLSKSLNPKPKNRPWESCYGCFIGLYRVFLRLLKACIDFYSDDGGGEKEIETTMLLRDVSGIEKKTKTEMETGMI